MKSGAVFLLLLAPNIAEIPLANRKVDKMKRKKKINIWGKKARNGLNYLEVSSIGGRSVLVLEILTRFFLLEILFSIAYRSAFRVDSKYFSFPVFFA